MFATEGSPDATQAEDRARGLGPSVEIQPRDLLLPARLLIETQSDESPLLVYSRRRAGRWRRRLIAFGYETTLLFVGYKIMTATDLRPFAFDKPLLPLFAFLLLRYHVFVNDQSHHIKLLGRDQLAHMLQTQMGANEYFLHHCLAFCQKYRVAFGFAGLMVAQFVFIYRHADLRWAWWEYFGPAMVCFSLVLLTWLAGVAQYILEWSLFAGGNLRIVQSLASPLISALLASPVMIISFSHFTGYGYNRGIISIAILAVVFGLGLALILIWGREVYRTATERLYERARLDDPDHMRDESQFPGVHDLLRPWSWRTGAAPRGGEFASPATAYPEIALGAALVGGVVFGLMFAAGTHAGFWKEYFARPEMLRATLAGKWPYMVLQAILPAAAFYAASAACFSWAAAKPVTSSTILARFGPVAVLVAAVLAIIPLGDQSVGDTLLGIRVNPQARWLLVFFAAVHFAYRFVAGFYGQIALWIMLLAVCVALLSQGRGMGGLAVRFVGCVVMAVVAGVFWRALWGGSDYFVRFPLMGMQGLHLPVPLWPSGTDTRAFFSTTSFSLAGSMRGATICIFSSHAARLAVIASVLPIAALAMRNAAAKMGGSGEGAKIG